MANALYTTAKTALMNGELNLSTDNLKVVLVDTGVYTANLTTDAFLSDVSGIVATSSTLIGTVVAAGVFSAADVTFVAVTGNSVEALVIYKDTGVASTSQLIAYIDTATGLPVTPDGSDISIVWDTGPNKIFSL